MDFALGIAGTVALILGLHWARKSAREKELQKLQKKVEKHVDDLSVIERATGQEVAAWGEEKIKNHSRSLMAFSKILKEKEAALRCNKFDVTQRVNYQQAAQRIQVELKKRDGFDVTQRVNYAQAAQRIQTADEKLMNAERHRRTL